MPTAAPRSTPPQAFVSSYAPRVQKYGNALITPVLEKPNVLPPVRTTKRGTTAINYAEDGFASDDFDDTDNGLSRRPTGLRSIRRDDGSMGVTDRFGFGINKHSDLGKELDSPIEVQGIWRDWMGKPKPLQSRTPRQAQVQSRLPLTLIPIRIDVDIPAFRPDAALPMPQNAREYGIDETLPAYRPSEMTPSYRLKDHFLWNLHEALVTPDQFARMFVEELDFANDKKVWLIIEIAKQIREQLEQYAGVALHPLFQASGSDTATAISNDTAVNRLNGGLRDQIQDRSTPTRTAVSRETAAENVTASATAGTEDSTSITLNADDTYRCIVTLSVNLLNRLYTDRFEWSLLHPPGLAEIFARQTCADLGLSAEWTAAIAHAIYEAVLRLKKEACENGGVLMVGVDGMLENDALPGEEAGWRYEPEHLASDWEPKVEVLSKEEIEKREGDRERQLRRVRRETARYSSTADVSRKAADGPNDYFGYGQTMDEDRPMGRGERSKKRRRFRSVSPSGRDTPEGASSSGAGYGGGVGSLSEPERQMWRCAHCSVWGTAVWAVRDGPSGPRSLCHNCGYLYEHNKQLPPWSKGLFAGEVGFGTITSARR